MGLAKRPLSEEDRGRCPHIPWTHIVGLVHLIVHGYFGIDTEPIWEITSKDAPALAALLREW